MSEGLVKQGPISNGDPTAGRLIAEGDTVRQIQTQYATAVAVQKPRDLQAVEKSCLAEAALAGEVCFYGWGTGQNRVEGPSIDCAMIAARNFGNAVVEMKPVNETAQAYIMEAAFVDLETGFTYTRQFRQSKSSIVHGRMDDERKADVRFQIGQSKAQRNVVLKALPKWLLDKMVNKAKEGVREQIQKHVEKNGLESARKKAADVLIKLGVSTERVEKKYDKKYPAWDVEILVLLQGDIRALSDGIESADSLFPENIETEETPTITDEDMKPGDAATHQGHDEADKETGEIKEKHSPVEVILEMESRKDFGEEKITDLREKFAGYADIRKADPEALEAYKKFLDGLEDKDF